MGSDWASGVDWKRWCRSSCKQTRFQRRCLLKLCFDSCLSKMADSLRSLFSRPSSDWRDFLGQRFQKTFELHFAQWAQPSIYESQRQLAHSPHHFGLGLLSFGMLCLWRSLRLDLECSFGLWLELRHSFFRSQRNSRLR